MNEINGFRGLRPLSNIAQHMAVKTPVSDSTAAEQKDQVSIGQYTSLSSMESVSTGSETSGSNTVANKDTHSAPANTASKSHVTQDFDGFFVAGASSSGNGCSLVPSVTVSELGTIAVIDEPSAQQVPVECTVITNGPSTADNGIYNVDGSKW